MINPFSLLPSEKEFIVESIWGRDTARYYMPVNASIGRLIWRTLMQRCVRCGRTKVSFDGGRICPVHEMDPGFREQDYPVNPKH